MDPQACLDRCPNCDEFDCDCTEDEKHVCTFGPITHGYITGEPSRRCTECGLVSLDLYDDDDE